MYLRLKPCSIAAPATCLNALGVRRYSLSRYLYERLIERNLDNFDWIHGGQSGPIKYIDLHQFEFAISRARAGSLVATLMVNLTLNGIRQLIVPEHGGACQYSTGSEWNNLNRLTTLSGQAVVLQALALAAGLRRRTSEFELGSRVNSFVEGNSQEIGLIPTPGSAAEPCAADTTRLRDKAWYATALHQFANVYGSTQLATAASQLFDSIVNIHPAGIASEESRAFTGPALTLNQIVAIAAALVHFGVAESKPKLLHQAKSLICKSVPQYVLADGGYAEGNTMQSDSDRVIDIDCTIDLVRTCLALVRTMPNSRILSIAQHGVCALYEPAIALARRPETGILLIAGELAELSAIGIRTVEQASI